MSEGVNGLSCLQGSDFSSKDGINEFWGLIFYQSHLCRFEIVQETPPSPGF